MIAGPAEAQGRTAAVARLVQDMNMSRTMVMMASTAEVREGRIVAVEQSVQTEIFEGRYEGLSYDTKWGECRFPSCCKVKLSLLAQFQRDALASLASVRWNVSIPWYLAT